MNNIQPDYRKQAIIKWLEQTIADKHVTAVKLTKDGVSAILKYLKEDTANEAEKQVDHTGQPDTVYSVLIGSLGHISVSSKGVVTNVTSLYDAYSRQFAGYENSTRNYNFEVPEGSFRLSTPDQKEIILVKIGDDRYIGCHETGEVEDRVFEAKDIYLTLCRVKNVDRSSIKQHYFMQIKSRISFTVDTGTSLVELATVSVDSEELFAELVNTAITNLLKEDK